MATVNSMKALGSLVIVKATKGGTGTILYSQHATKIGSHNGQGEVDYYKTSQALTCVARVLSSIFFEKQHVFEILTGTNFIHFHH